MNRLPDVYYTEKVLDGNGEFYGINQLPPNYLQGEDIRLVFGLSPGQNPVLSDTTKLELILKKSKYADNILWYGTIGSGLYAVDGKPGYYYMLMPSQISAAFLPGSYYIDILATEKTGTGQDIKDLTTVALSFVITIELGASSPNPKLKAYSTEIIAFDPVTGIITIQSDSVEPTQPPWVDTRNF